MRVLVVGHGSMGRRHAANARALGHEVAVCDPRQETVTDIRWHYFSLAAALDYLPHAVAIATPARTHADVFWRIRRAFPLVPILVEKPLALSEQDWGRQSLELPNPCDAVGYNWRFHPEVIAWRARIGEVQAFHLACDTRIRSWLGRDYADPLLECSHEIDLLRWWCQPSEIQLVAAWLLNDGGVGQGIHLQFDTGDIDVRWDAPPSRRMFAQRRNGHSRWLWPSTWQAVERSYRDELAAFLRPIETGESSGCATIADGVAVLRICAQARQLAGLTVNREEAVR